MARKKKPSSAPENFDPKKWDRLEITWRDAAATKTTEELKEEIVKSAQEIGVQRKTMKNDSGLKAATEEVKTIRGGFMEVINEEQAKIDFCLYTLTNRGAA